MFTVRSFICLNLRHINGIHLLSQILDQVLDELGEVPSREATPETFEKEPDVKRDTTTPEHFFQDCTERPKDPQVQRTIIVAKRNNTLSKIICYLMLCAKYWSCLLCANV